jgi:hypothetical protein
MADVWTPYVDGFVYGNIGVFPGHFGSWDVWDNFGGKWEPVYPPLYAAREGKDYCRGRRPAFLLWERSPDETMAEARRLAEAWLSALGGGHH